MNPAPKLRDLVLAFGLVALATGTRWLLTPVLAEGSPFFTQILAVLFASWLGGLWPGIFAALLGYAASAYLFISPPGFGVGSDIDSILRVLTFALICATIVLLMHSMREAWQRAEESVAALRQQQVLIERESEQRRQAQEALTRQAEALAKSNAELERFAYVASHDLQEPMRTVHSFSQLLKERCAGQLGDEADECLHFITAGVYRMRTLINDLLAYSRVGSDSTDIQRVNMETVLREALANLRVMMEQMDARVTHDPLPEVEADATQIGQVLQNLISNGVDSTQMRPPW